MSLLKSLMLAAKQVCRIQRMHLFYRSLFVHICLFSCVYVSFETSDSAIKAGTSNPQNMSLLYIYFSDIHVSSEASDSASKAGTSNTENISLL